MLADLTIVLVLRTVSSKGSCPQALVPAFARTIRGEPEHGVSGSAGGLDRKGAVGSTLPVEGIKGCPERQSPSGPAVLSLQVGTPSGHVGDVGL